VGAIDDAAEAHSRYRPTATDEKTRKVFSVLVVFSGWHNFGNIGADSTGTTGNFAPVLTQEPGQTLRFAPVPFMAVL